MFKAAIKNSRGERLQLSPNPYYAITAIDGLTPPAATLNFSPMATNDGSIFNSSRVDNRNIVLTIVPLQDIESSRINLYKFFKIKQYCEFYFTNGSREVYIPGYIESIEGSLFERSQSLQISIICPKPYFRALTETITDISQVVPVFTFPAAIAAAGVEFAQIVHNSERNIYNSGDAEAGLIIELIALGSVSDPVIYDEHNGSFSIDIDMQEGDIITINTNKGEKSVLLTRDGNNTNIINQVAEDPTWFQLQPGDNVFSYSASALTLLQIVFKHYSQYEGV